MSNKIKTYLILFGVIVLLCAVCWFVFFRNDVHDNGGGVGDARAELERVADEQRDVAEHLGRIDSGLADSAGQVDAVARSVDEIAGGVGKFEQHLDSLAAGIASGESVIADSERRITESLAICERIRSRASTP